MSPYLRVRRVDDTGLSLVALGDRPVDVCVDGRRVWTFWTLRDSVAGPVPPAARGRWPVRTARWPRTLRTFLDGRAWITVRDTVTGAELFEREVRLGSGEGEILVRNAAGVDLGIDKSGRLMPTFAGRTSEDIGGLLDATEAVLTALREAGVEPFLAYGTLLGAVREGKVLGHDSDADLGYISRFTVPVDIATESLRLQRHLAERGWRTFRHSGGAFKIMVTEGKVTRGLDVFGGFMDDGRLRLMGEVDAPFERDWLFPLGTASLHGRPMPVPARPERLLEVTYGPGWAVPDPAFKFTTPERTVRAFDDWFRGTSPRSRYWSRQAHKRAGHALPPKPTALGRRALQLARELDAEVLDVGAGRGRDSVWLARQGVSVIAYDYVVRMLETAGAHAQSDGLPLEVRYLNLAEWRSVLSEGARLARAPRPRVVVARHVVDATSAAGAESLARLCSMALRDGGRLITDFYVRTEEQAQSRSGPPWLVGRTDVDAFVEHLRGAGAQAVRVGVRRKRGMRVARVVGAW